MATTWALGHYPAMAERLMPAAELAVERATVRRGERVLDVACGTGNAALVAVEHTEDVVGVDFEPALLDIARGRDRGDRVEWLQGDVAALGVADSGFDVVLSVFGCMYAPDHEAAASELSRACAQGGRVVLTAWTPQSFMPSMGAILADYLPPPPPGSGPPSRWGEEGAVGALLGAAGLETEERSRHSLDLLFADVAAATSFLIDTAGHVIAERTRLQAEGRWDALRAALAGLVAERNRRAGDGVDLALDYLLVLARG
jgi:SAM-dependent methyltransferase